MANYPQKLAHDAVCQSHTGHMTGLWFLPPRPLRSNTNEKKNIYIRGKAMANYPQELVQYAVCQSHTGHMTGLWFLPTRPLRLNTNE